jgi:hypothetical protein
LRDRGLDKPRRAAVLPIGGHEKNRLGGRPFLLRVLLFGPEKPAALGVVVRERPAFRSAFAKHPLDRGRGICRARPRYKALLGKVGGDGAKRAAVIQLCRRLDHFRAKLGNALAAFALAAAVQRYALFLGALTLAGSFELGNKLPLRSVSVSKSHYA